ncbi:DUF262 domain-containing protein [Streptomyces sp. NPDC051976]|uniref:DUF262 domain-containing protein n=1 Tax=Streptomyces sp. NPDC051976 TaxID=3154947 RepID=UPI0034494811
MNATSPGAASLTGCDPLYTLVGQSIGRRRRATGDMADAESGSPGAGRREPPGARGYATPEDVGEEHDPFSLGVPLEIGPDGRPTGVELELPSDDEDDQGDPPDDVDGAPFRPEEIRIHTETTTVDLLLSRLREEMIDLKPDFQRRVGVWDDVRQSRLIESLLLRIPISNFHMAQMDDDRWAVVDGVQRLTAIARFMEPGLTGLGPLALRGLDYLWGSNGSTYQDLAGRMKIRLRESQLTVHIIEQGTPESVKYNVFSRINTGGVPLTAQELRHALVAGPVRAFLADLAEDPSFGLATQWSVSSERMADRELVLRFLAFRLTNPTEYAEKDFASFLTAAMYRVNALDEEQRKQLIHEFRLAMGCASFLFGKQAFRKRRDGPGRSPINKALFETIAVNLALLDPEEIGRLIASQDILLDRFGELQQDWDFDRSISIGTGDPAKVRTRFQYMARLFRGVAEQ